MNIPTRITINVARFKARDDTWALGRKRRRRKRRRE